MKRHSAMHLGFTLIELVVVVALLSLGATLGIRLLFKVSDTWKKVSTRTALEERVDVLFSRMKQDFEAMPSTLLAGATLRGTERSIEDSRYPKVPLGDDEVVIPVSAVVDEQVRVARRDVVYRVDRSSGTPVMTRLVYASNESVTPLAREQVADGTLALTVEYLDRAPGSDWTRTWTKPVPPGLVRVGVTVFDPGHGEEQIARKTVFSIKVN